MGKLGTCRPVDNSVRLKRARKKKPRIPKSYAEVPGCHNCKHCFIWYEYDEAPEYYCTKNAPKRPKCGSVAMSECPKVTLTKSGMRAFTKMKDKWQEWSRDREIRPWGCCEKYVLDPHRPAGTAPILGVTVIQSVVTSDTTTITYSTGNGWGVTRLKKGKA